MSRRKKFVWLSLIAVLLSLRGSGNSKKNTVQPVTCEQLARAFGDALHEKEYKTAYSYTTGAYQNQVSLADFIETDRRMRQQKGDPKKWGISEVGFFETDTGHGVGIDFGNEEYSPGEIKALYRCILMFEDEKGMCRAKSVQWGTGDDDDDDDDDDDKNSSDEEG